MTSLEKNLIDKLNELVKEISELNQTSAIEAQNNSEAIKALNKDMIPLLKDLQGKEVPADTTSSIIEAYRKLFDMYVDQNNQYLRHLNASMENNTELTKYLIGMIEGKV